MEALIIISCLLLSAFFSGMEIAYVSANKVYLSVEQKQDTLLSKILFRLTKDPTQFITAMLVGNSIALVLYGYNMAHAVMRWVNPDLFAMNIFLQMLIQVTVATFIILITAEFVPKVFFQAYANRLIKVLAIPAYIFYRLFYPFSRGLLAVANFLLVTVFRTSAHKQKGYFTRAGLGSYVNEQFSSASVQQEVDAEIAIFKNALEFTGRQAKDIMTPRSELIALDVSSSVEDLRQLFIQTGYSKIIAYNKNIDAIKGYVHSFALFKSPENIPDVMLRPVYAPQSILIKELLNQLTRARKSMAVIHDAEGKTAGVITVEDIIEELFGEIEDEHDTEDL
jgi:CBS domain containing-hemolysin-like protein